jgi:hypothetical protein
MWCEKKKMLCRKTARFNQLPAITKDALILVETLKSTLATEFKDNLECMFQPRRRNTNLGNNTPKAIFKFQELTFLSSKFASEADFVRCSEENDEKKYPQEHAR